MVYTRNKYGGLSEHLKYHKTSIATEYLKSTFKKDDMKTLFKILKKRTQSHHIPSKNEIVIHLRLGDVLSHFQNEKNISKEDILFKELSNSKIRRYVPNINFFKYVIDEIKKKKINLNKITLVYGFHVKHKKNLEKTNYYINNLKKLFLNNNFKVKLRSNENADDDFLYMSNASFFVSSGGNFSRLIKSMIILNKKTIVAEYPKYKKKERKQKEK